MSQRCKTVLCVTYQAILRPARWGLAFYPNAVVILNRKRPSPASAVVMRSATQRLTSCVFASTLRRCNPPGLAGQYPWQIVEKGALEICEKVG